MTDNEFRAKEAYVNLYKDFDDCPTEEQIEEFNTRLEQILVGNGVSVTRFHELIQWDFADLVLNSKE